MYGFYQLWHKLYLKKEIIVMKPGASECWFVCLEGAKTHLRASTGQNNFSVPTGKGWGERKEGGKGPREGEGKGRGGGKGSALPPLVHTANTTLITLTKEERHYFRYGSWCVRTTVIYFVKIIISDGRHLRRGCHLTRITSRPLRNSNRRLSFCNKSTTAPSGVGCS